MRTCTKCGKTKFESEFNWKITNVKRSSQCKACHKLYRKDHYLQNKEKYIAKANEYRKINGRTYSRNQIYCYEYLLHHSCVDCNESNPILLQFDHIDPSTKSFNISSVRRDTVSLEELKCEISKCAVRCVVCHTLRTAEQYNWYRWYSDLDPKYKNQYIQTGFV